MKQNERILVYAVTGFLAIILVVAVLFGRGNGPLEKSGGNASTPGLADVLPGGKSAVGKAEADKPAGPKSEVPGPGEKNGALGDKSGLPAPDQSAGEQPLVAPSKPMIAAELVAQQLGTSHRDHSVRIVRARAGDSLETLVRRWCGSPQFLEEAKSLNEDLTVIRVGQEVAVPWVDDDVVYAAFEARQPKKLTAEGGEVAANGAGNPGSGNSGSGNPAASPLAPGGGSGTKPNGPVPANASGAGKPVDGSLAGNRPYAPPSRMVTLGGDGKPEGAKNDLAKNEVAKNVGPKTDGPKTDGGKPEAGRVDPAKSATPPAPVATKTKSYVVRSGDSLWKIAERLAGKKGADKMVAEIRKLNPDLGDTLKVNQKLVVPDVAAAPATTKTGP